MANIFVNIPVPAANGSGAAVDMTSFGFQKTISVYGPYEAAVTIEISNEAVPTKWAPLITFNRPDGIVMDIACRWMRASVAGYSSGTPGCYVGGEDNGTLYANLPVSAGDGVGAAVDVSGLGPFKTLTVGDVFTGNVQVEVSEDGVNNWSQIGFGFTNPGQQSQNFIAHYMRVRRGGTVIGSEGTPLVNVAASQFGSSVGPAGPSVVAFLPEQWAVLAVPANQPATAMSAQVSTNFDDISATRPGSLVGLRARLTEAVTAGSIVVAVTLNGVATALTLTLDTPDTEGVVTALSGVIPYVAGDKIGVQYTTDAGYTPSTANLEAYISVIEPEV